MGFFGDLFSGDAEREAAERNRALYQSYENRGMGFLDTGLSRSTGALNAGYDSAIGAYQPLATRYGAVSGLYEDALGVNGAAGNQRAVDSFQAGPGYQFALDQGNQAVERRRAASGMWDSGNTDIDLTRFSQGQANQEYGNWLSRLGAYVPLELQATGNIANASIGRGTGLAGMYSQDASDRIGLVGNTTSGMASANNQEAAGRSAGARNLLSAGMGIASLAAGGLGGGFGGALGGALGGNFS